MTQPWKSSRHTHHFKHSCSLVVGLGIIRIQPDRLQLITKLSKFNSHVELKSIRTWKQKYRGIISVLPGSNWQWPLLHRFLADIVPLCRLEKQWSVHAKRSKPQMIRDRAEERLGEGVALVTSPRFWKRLALLSMPPTPSLVGHWWHHLVNDSV